MEIKFATFSTILKIISLLTLFLGIILCGMCVLLFAWEDNLVHKIQSSRKVADMNNKTLSERVKISKLKTTEELKKARAQAEHLKQIEDDWMAFRTSFYAVMGVVLGSGALITIPSAFILCSSDKGAKKYSRYWIVLQGLIGLILMTADIVMHFCDRNKRGNTVGVPSYQVELLQQRQSIYQWFYYMTGTALGGLAVFIISACILVRCISEPESTTPKPVPKPKPANQNYGMGGHSQGQSQNHGSDQNYNQTQDQGQRQGQGHGPSGGKIPVEFHSNPSHLETKPFSIAMPTNNVSDDSSIPVARRDSNSVAKRPRPVTRFELKCMSIKSKVLSKRNHDRDALVEDQFL